MADPLLPRDGLSGVRLGLSVSDSPDLGRLGLTEWHVRAALGDVTRAMLVSGGELVYGGHLDPGGYTMFLQDELQKYARRDRPLLVCLAWPLHRRLALAELRDAEDRLGRLGRIVYLDAAGQPVDRAVDRGEEPAPVEERDVVQASLTRLREYMAARTHARLIVGGRRSGFQGRMPGVVEEAVIGVRAGQPLFLAGGFGGVAADMLVALGRLDASWVPPPDQATPGIDDFAAAARDGNLADNGLRAAETAQLAATHRASEIANLVALGLGRLRAAGRL